MTDEQNAQQASQVVFNAQFVKDLSFENPNAPASLLPKKEQPNINLTVNVNAQAMENNAYEVSLQLTADAKSGEDALFVTELTYAGIFTLVNVPEEEKELALLIYCPNLLFPFARRVISDATRDGGFPPLVVEPIDFAALYNARRKQNDEEQQASA